MARTVKQLLAEVAHRIGRGPEDVEPYVDLLKSNWYEDEKSLGTLSFEEVKELGVPLRLAKELEAIGVLRGDAMDGDGRSKHNRAGKGKGADKGKGGKGEKGSREKGGKVAKNFAIENIIDVDTQGSEFTFPWKAKIFGEDNRNVRHIQQQTGTTILLRGRGSSNRHRDDDETLHLFIGAEAHVKQSDFDKAINMCEDLLETVYQDFSEWVEEKGEEFGDDCCDHSDVDGVEDELEGPHKSSKNKGKGKGRFRGRSKGKGKGKGKGKPKGKDKSRRNDDSPRSKRPRI
mmetsp:Transcript_58449/g.162980  ORF Transcript_58449/g.162980 Transcript_58449/m.162980 type:complete len:288 (-) Transcript_58449:88-951(-)